MTDQGPRPPPAGEPPERKRRGGVPPLVWIILALLAVWFVVAWMQRGGTHETPQGGTTPMQAEGPSIMPPAPARGDAPATPGAVVNAQGEGPPQP